ncbi:hypothetical protein ABPG74_017366 [Tetrahymena malaccensis]
MSVPNKYTLLFYRRMLHTMMKAFPEDYNMFHSCRIECRRKILENKNEKDPIKIQDHIFFGEEIRDMLENNLMQGNLQQNGNYRFKARPEHAMGEHVKPIPKDN